MRHRNPIASILLTAFSLVVLPVNLFADLAAVETSNQREAVAIVGAYLLQPSSIPASDSRQFGIRDANKKKRIHVLTFGLLERPQLQFRSCPSDTNFLRRWQPHPVRLICDRSPPIRGQN